MDHVRISGNEPSSLILSQTKWIQKLKMIARKCQKQSEGQKDGVINPQTYYSINFDTDNLMLSKRNESTEVDSRLCCMCSRGQTGPPAVTLTK